MDKNGEGMTHLCPQCGGSQTSSVEMVYVSQTQKTRGIGIVDRQTKMDTTWNVRAVNEANAKVKAELEGIVVTSVERA